MRQLVTRYSRVDWSRDGQLVTKVRVAGPDGRRRFRNELRVNRLLVDLRPPVPTPRLVGHEVQRRRLTFEAFAGEPLGPKYPDRLASKEVEGIVEFAGRLGSYRPRRRWFRRIDPVRRLHLARGAGLLDDAQLAGLLPLAARLRGTLRFAHGDITARNVLAVGDGAGDDGRAGGLALIDWEWAGLYPPAYDLAFLWYSLVDLPDARTTIERHALASSRNVDEPAFLLSALLVQLWHLHWYLPAGEHRPKHEATLAHLLARLGHRSRTEKGPGRDFRGSRNETRGSVLVGAWQRS